MTSHQIEVALISGRTVQVPARAESTLKEVKLLAQSALQTGMGVLRDSTGEIVDERQTVGAAGLKQTDVLTLQVRQTMVARTRFTFAAMLGDGSVVTWGPMLNLFGESCGADSSAAQQQLRNVQHIQATDFAFAAVLDTGDVVTWGGLISGGDSKTVQEQLKNVQHIQASRRAFAAVLDTGSVVTWGDPRFGGDSSAVQEQLKNVQHIQASRSAFAAVLDTGCVISW